MMIPTHKLQMTLEELEMVMKSIETSVRILTEEMKGLEEASERFKQLQRDKEAYEDLAFDLQDECP